jgi:hypothetical protein
MGFDGAYRRGGEEKEQRRREAKKHVEMKTRRDHTE